MPWVCSMRFTLIASVKMIGVEAAGHGVHTHQHSATLTKGAVGVLHGSKSKLLQDSDGQVQVAHSIAAGLDYPGVGPEHAYYQESKRAQYVTITDKEAIEALKLLSRLEGIIPALETSHAIAYLAKISPPCQERINGDRLPFRPRGQRHEPNLAIYYMESE